MSKKNIFYFETLAKIEGLDAHKNAVKIRLKATCEGDQKVIIF
jgi:histidinol dehydrogenase